MQPLSLFTYHNLREFMPLPLRLSLISIENVESIKYGRHYLPAYRFFLYIRHTTTPPLNAIFIICAQARFLCRSGREKCDFFNYLERKILASVTLAHTLNGSALKNYWFCLTFFFFTLSPWFKFVMKKFYSKIFRKKKNVQRKFTQ